MDVKQKRRQHRIGPGTTEVEASHPQRRHHEELLDRGFRREKPGVRETVPVSIRHLLCLCLKALLPACHPNPHEALVHEVALGSIW